MNIYIFFRHKNWRSTNLVKKKFFLKDLMYPLVKSLFKNMYVDEDDDMSVCVTASPLIYVRARPFPVLSS